MKVIYSDEFSAMVALDSADEVVRAVLFHGRTLRQGLVAVRFPQWAALVRASILLTMHGIEHRVSSINETAEQLDAATIHGGVHLFLDDPPGPVSAGAAPFLQGDYEAAAAALELAVDREAMGGALGAWRLKGGTPYRLAVVRGHAVAIRRATVRERAHGLGFVHLHLFCPFAKVVVATGWPDDPGLEAELLEAEARLAAVAPARGDA